MGTSKIRTSETESRLPKPAKRALRTGIDSRQAAFAAANAAESKKGHGTLILDVGQVTVLADYFVIAGGDSLTQVRAIVDAIEEVLDGMGLRPKSIEGKKEGRWVLMDYEEIIVHVLHERERSYYKLEQFWNHALILDRKEWYDEDAGGVPLTQKPSTGRMRKRTE